VSLIDLLCHPLIPKPPASVHASATSHSTPARKNAARSQSLLRSLANLDDGSALMAFQIRGKDGVKVWAYAGIRDASGRFTRFEPDQVTFEPQRTWRSPHTDATYPVSMRIQTGSTVWLLTPLMDDQELDSRQSTGAVYWEGAVTITRDGKPAGHGYLELTGYVEPLKL
jgi:predicted secreted hydrolase